MIEAGHRFQKLSEADVLAALVEPASLVSYEVDRLASAYVDRLRKELQKHGYIPPHLLHIEVRYPIEAVAMKRAKATVNDLLDEL